MKIKTRPRLPKQRRTRQRKFIKLLLVTGLLVATSLLLSACTYPGQDPPCQGVNRAGAGCPILGTIGDDPNGGDWYVGWALNIVRTILSSIAIAAVKIGVGIFYVIFSNISSTDFAACNLAGASSTSPTCAVTSVFNTVRIIAFAFLPVIIAWKIFKSYFVGAIIEEVHEPFILIAFKTFLVAIVLYFMDYIVTGAFGLRNILFSAIIGGPQTLSNLGAGIVNSVGSTDHVNNIGLLLFLTFICIVTGIVYIFLGLAFFLATIIVFILFALSPLAEIAFLTEEFKGWFYKWLESIQAMLIAPIPTAICFALVNVLTGTSCIASSNGDPNQLLCIPQAHDDIAGFVLKYIYIISFLAIGALMSFKIAGGVGGLYLGIASAGLGHLSGTISGRARARTKETTEDGQTDTATTGPVGSNLTRAGSRTNSAPAKSREQEQLAMPEPSISGQSVAVTKQQDELINAVRGLSQTMSGYGNGSSPITPVNALSRPGSMSAMGGGFDYQAERNTQALIHYAGSAVDINSPYLSWGGASSPRATTRPNQPPPALPPSFEEEYPELGRMLAEFSPEEYGEIKGEFEQAYSNQFQRTTRYANSPTQIANRQPFEQSPEYKDFQKYVEDNYRHQSPEAKSERQLLGRLRREFHQEDYQQITSEYYAKRNHQQERVTRFAPANDNLNGVKLETFMESPEYQDFQKYVGDYRKRVASEYPQVDYSAPARPAVDKGNANQSPMNWPEVQSPAPGRYDQNVRGVYPELQEWPGAPMPPRPRYRQRLNDQESFIKNPIPMPFGGLEPNLEPKRAAEATTPALTH